MQMYAQVDYIYLKTHVEFFMLKLKKYENICLLKCVTVWCCFRRAWYSYCGKLTMEAQISTATVTTAYQTRRCHNPKDRILCSLLHDSLKRMCSDFVMLVILVRIIFKHIPIKYLFNKNYNILS